MARPPKECIECSYDTANECDMCDEAVCDDCIELHCEWEHSDQESEL